MISFISSLSKTNCGNQILWKQSRLENDPTKITPHWLLYIQFYTIVKMPGPCVGVCNYLVDIHNYCNPKYDVHQLPSMDRLKTWIATTTMVAMVAVDIQLPFLWELIFLLGLVVAKPINQLYGCSKQSWDNGIFTVHFPFSCRVILWGRESRNIQIGPNLQGWLQTPSLSLPQPNSLGKLI